MRFVLGMLLALFCGIQLAILSLPISAAIFPARSPRDQFSGLGMLGGTLLLGGGALAIGATGGCLLLLIFGNDSTAPRFVRVVKTLAISVGVFIASLFVFAKADAGILWAAGASALTVVIGIPFALRRRSTF